MFPAFIASLLFMVPAPGDSGTYRVPVVEAEVDGVLTQIGWQRFKYSTREYLYCVRDQDTKVVCIAKINTPEGIKIVWVWDLEATELGT